jgi:predicted DNA-binding transcriptional regulator AlpA
MKNKSEEKVLLRAEDIASMISVSKRTVFRYKKNGLIPQPTVDNGKIQRWDKQQVIMWIQSGCPDVKSIPNMRPSRNPRFNR